MDHNQRPDPMNDPRPIRLSKPLPPLDEPLIPQHEKDKLKPKKGGALRPLEKLNRAVFRTLLIGVPVAGLTIVAILLSLNVVDNGFGRWVCRLRLGPNKIVYTNGLEDGARLWLTNLDGTVACPLINRQSAVGAWSPDGKQIAFSSRIGDDTQIFVINADGSGERQLTTTGGDTPLWSPDGSKILYEVYAPNASKPHAYMMNADGSNQQRLPAGEFVQDWSGQSILYLDVTQDDNQSHFQIWKMDASGQNAERVLHSNASDMATAWSPDGKQIVFSSERAQTGYLQIYLMDANGQNIRRLTNDTLEDEYPRFSSDGKMILFSRRSDACGDVYAMNLDGTNQRRLTHGGCASGPGMP